MAVKDDSLKFKTDIPRIAQLLNRRVSDVVRYTALNFVREVIPAHPVDTGYSRANWRMAEDHIDRTVSAPPSRKTKSKYPMRSPQGGDVSLNADHVFVTNSVHYVRWLEAGHSKRAPANFILMAAQRAVAKINAMVVKAKKDNPAK
jgi:hypothetical protein